MPERFLEETRLAAPPSPVQTAKSTLTRGKRPLQARFLIFSIQEWQPHGTVLLLRYNNVVVTLCSYSIIIEGVKHCEEADARHGGRTAPLSLS